MLADYTIWKGEADRSKLIYNYRADPAKTVESIGLRAAVLGYQARLSLRWRAASDSGLARKIFEHD